jgi:hypothetical protein
MKFRKTERKHIEEKNYVDNPELLCSIYRLPDTGIRKMEEHDLLLLTALQLLASRSRLQWGSWLEAVVSVVLGTKLH